MASTAGNKRLKGKPAPIELKKDFFEWEYLVNSPKDMISRFRELPFVEHDESSGRIKAQTPFLEIETYYREIGEDLFMICSEAAYKANICFKYIYDKTRPAEFYCLSLRVHSHAKTVNSLVNGVGYSDNSWLIFKPGARVDHHHFKGTKGRYISMYFTQKWLDGFIRSTPEESTALAAFLNAGTDYLICPYLQESTLFHTDFLFELLANGRSREPENTKKLEDEVRIFFGSFRSKMLEEKIDEQHFTISSQERMKIILAERILSAGLYGKFPGITFLARETGFSETKLKECFRKVYGNTLSGYFHGIQMKKAKELIQNSDLPIKQVAQKLGYENKSKFSAAFRKYHTVLPSELKQMSTRYES